MEDDLLINDQETLVIIEDSNVENTYNDIIFEEKLIDDLVLILNPEQIINELTNLFIKYKDQYIIQKKINACMKFFNSIDINKFNFYNKNIFPIILCNRKVIVNENDKKDIYGGIDTQRAIELFMQTQKFENYISQFKSLNYDKSDYLRAAESLYALSKPFSNTIDPTYNFNILDNEVSISSINIINKNTIDAYRHFIFDENNYESFKLIPEISVDTGKRSEVHDTQKKCTAGLHYLSESNIQNIYEGDNISLIGYFNYIDFKNNQKYLFDINKYFEYIFKLPLNTIVNIYFNDFIFDNSIDNNLINKEYLEGIIIENNNNTIKVKTDIQIFTIKKNKPNIGFIYDKNYKFYKFYKPLLRTDNITFTLLNNTKHTDKESLDIIQPKSLSELLFLHKNDIHRLNNIYEIKKYFNDILNIDFNQINNITKIIINNIINHNNNLPQNISLKQPKFNIHKINTYDLLNFEKYNTILQNINNSYNDFNKFKDSELNRYNFLSKNYKLLYYYLISYIKKEITNKYKIYSKKLSYYKDKIKTYINNENSINDKISKNNDESKIIIAKIYYNIDDLNNDNFITIYFDKDLDNTQYNIINNINEKLPDDEKKYAIIEELKKLDKYDINTLKFEAASILKGKRRVRYGDYAKLFINKNDYFLYIRKNINDGNEVGQMWIKTQSSSPSCTAELIDNFDDIQNNKLIMLDPFDSICKKRENISLNLKYSDILQNISTLEYIINFIEKFNDNDINNDIVFFEKQLKLIDYNRQIFTIINSYEEYDSSYYEDYEGDDTLFSIDKNLIVDSENTFILENSDYNKEKLRNNEDILQIFIKSIDINLPDNIYNYILNQINAYIPPKTGKINYRPHSPHIKEQIIELLKEEEVKLKSNKRFKSIYDAYKQKKMNTIELDNEINKLLNIFEIKEYKKYYYSVILYTASLLILTIMIEYPNILIKKINPKCLQYFSYIGHPISQNDNSTKSLTKYFTCIISSIGTPGDYQFDQFNAMKFEEIENLIKETIDNICKDNIEISNIIKNKENLIKKFKISEKNYDKYLILNNFYKPQFIFSSSNDNIFEINYLKEINNIIKKSNTFKKTIYNTSVLINSCCIEKLHSNINFYDYFVNFDNSEFKKLYKKISTKSQKFLITKSYIPISYINNHINLFNKQDITIKSYIYIPEIDISNNYNQDDKINIFINNNLIFKNDILDNLSNKFNNNDWWDDILYPNLYANFNNLNDILIKYNNTISIVELKSIVYGTSFNIYNKLNLRKSILSFIKYKLPSKLLSFINKKIIINDKKNPQIDIYNNIVNIIESNKYNKLDKIKYIIQNSIKDIDNLLFYEKNDLIKNISILIYIFVKILLAILYININNDYNISLININNIQNNNENIKIACSVISYLINEFNNYISINDINIEKLKKTMEELREKRKQELIALHSSDDETRRLQRVLKDMGIAITDTTTLNNDNHTNNLINQNIPNLERENYLDYGGDNQDDNENENDQYFADQEGEFER